MGKTRPRHTEVALPRGRKPAAPTLAPPVAAAMAEVRKAAREATLLNAMFWRDHRSDRLKSLETSRAEMQEFKSRDQPDGPAPPARRAHGQRGPDPARPARPRFRARGGGLADGGEVGGRPARRHRARGRPRRGHLPLRPAVRAIQEARGAVGPRREGAGALRFEARRVQRCRSERRHGAPGLRRLRPGDRGTAGLGAPSNHGRLARDVDPAAARAAARAVRHPAGARRHPVAGAADASRGGQPRLLLERAAVAADAAPQHPRGPRLPRALAPRLRRGGPRRRRRHASATSSRSRAT